MNENDTQTAPAQILAQDAAPGAEESANAESLLPDPAAGDSDSLAPAPVAGGETEISALRRELNQLKTEIAAHGERFGRIDREYDEFHRLYPDTPLEALPDGVWADVKSGIPLAAAYALAERRNLYAERVAAESNAQNRLRSAGAASPGEKEEFTREEVMAMSADEVRANYRQIRQSMSKWN